MTHCLGFLITLVISFNAHATLEYDSSQLMMKNSDQVNDIIRKKMKVAEDAQAGQKDDEDEDSITAQPEAIQALTDAMRIALSRPDQDGSREEMYSRVRRELADLGSTEVVLEDLAKEGIEGLKSDNTPKVHATYITLLENLMAEIRPDIANNQRTRKIVESIRDAKIKLSSKVRSQQLLQSMKKPVSPSETAENILKALPKEKKK
jgi:hypothetical protein